MFLKYLEISKQLQSKILEKKKNSDGVTFSEPTGFPPATILKN